MDSLTRKLIELNAIRRGVTSGLPTSDSQVISQEFEINKMQNGVDFEINNINIQGCPAPDYDDIDNDNSDKLESALFNSILMTTFYTASLTDNYIGVSITVNSILTLPESPPDNIVYFIKLEYGEPMSSRNLTISASGTNTIDGDISIFLSSPYDFAILYSRGNNWHILNRKINSAQPATSQLIDNLNETL